MLTTVFCGDFRTTFSAQAPTPRKVDEVVQIHLDARSVRLHVRSVSDIAILT